MIKQSFEELTKIQKLQLYMLVPMLFWLIIFGFENIFLKSYAPSNTSYKKVETFNTNKLEKTSKPRIIKLIEDKTEYYKVALHLIDIKQNLISIEVSGVLENSLLFLQKIQTHLDVVSFKFLQEENSLKLFVTVNSKYLFNKKLLEKEFNIEKKNIEQQSHNIKIDAIIGNEVLVDGIWYKKGSLLNNYEIVEIGKSFILIKDLQTKRSVTVELSNESL